MAYADLATIQATDPGDVLTAAWCDQARDNEEFLINPPACSVYASSAQSVANATFVSLTANSEYFDNDSMHSTATNTSRITIQTAGRYLLSATIAYTAGSGRRFSQFLVNGTTAYDGDGRPAIGGGSDDKIVMTRTLVLAASDYVEVQANQNTGGNLNVTLREFVALFMTR